MIALRASEIVEAVGGQLLAGDPDALVESVTIDSRLVAAADCFFAIVGERHDGHDFLGDADAAGAAVLVAAQAPAAHTGDSALVVVEDTTAALQALAASLRVRLDPTVVAITGSLGKTTTKELAVTLLRTRLEVHATPGNLNNHWGLPLSLLGLEPHHQVMVAELAMNRAGEIRALAKLAAPDLGLITNVAPAHMENFADLDAVAAAKAELAEELKPNGVLVVNADDERTMALAEAFSARVAHLITFGRGEGASVWAVDVEASPSGRGWIFSLAFPETSPLAATLELPGAAGLANFLAAAAIAWALEIPPEVIAETAATLEPLPNRGAVRRLANGVVLLDESYNASPEAVKGALETLSGIAAEGRRVAVLGDMLELGDWTEATHREIGSRAAELGVDLIVAVGANAQEVAAGARDAGMADDATRRFEDAAEAAAWLMPVLRTGDLVLVKGSRAVHMERVVEAMEQTVPDQVVEG